MTVRGLPNAKRRRSSHVRRRSTGLPELFQDNVENEEGIFTLMKSRKKADDDKIECRFYVSKENDCSGYIRIS